MESIFTAEVKEDCGEDRLFHNSRVLETGMLIENEKRHYHL